MATKTKSEPKYYGTGKRKTAIARVWLSTGKGKITVNEKPWENYFGNRFLYSVMMKEPFAATGTEGQFDVIAKTRGGGLAGQAAAVRHGISRALLLVNPEFRKPLRRGGLLTRDPRVKERKKYGHKRARKSFQYSKR